MDSKIESEFNKLEKSRFQLFAKLDEKEEPELNYHPDKNKWSVIQVLNHLIITEQLSIKYINKKLTYRTNIKKTGLSAAIRFFVLKLMLQTPLRFKAPEIVSEAPDNGDFNYIKSQWDQTRKELRKLLDDLPEEFLNKNIFKHAIAGKMNIYQTLGFMEEHFKHHLKQIDRIEKSFIFAKN